MIQTLFTQNLNAIYVRVVCIPKSAVVNVNNVCRGVREIENQMSQHRCKGATLHQETVHPHGHVAVIRVCWRDAD